MVYFAGMFARLYLKSGRDRSVLRGHPWVYSGAVQRCEATEAGTIVAVCDPQDEVLGYGWYAPGRNLACRIFHLGEVDYPFDAQYWTDRFDNAWQLRQALLPLHTPTTAYRLLHGEGDGLPGLIVDVYAEGAAIQARVPGADALVPLLTEFLQSKGLQHLAVQTDEEQPPHWALGGTDDLWFEENGLRFRADLMSGQKTGYFIDQRENRALVRRYARGRRVLDVFSYAGGFGLHTLAGGAERAVSIDAMEKAVALCRSNAENNGLADRYEAVKTDAFQYLRRLEHGTFDLIVLDPPAFTKSPKTVDQAARGYKDINLNALRALPSGGLLFTFSCSQHIDADLFRKIVFGAAVDAGRAVRILHQLHQPPDHPVSLYHPEGEYLKGLALWVE